MLGKQACFWLFSLMLKLDSLNDCVICNDLDVLHANELESFERFSFEYESMGSKLIFCCLSC